MGIGRGYDRAARAYDNWLQTDPAMEEEAERDAQIENVEEGIYKAVTGDWDETWEMFAEGNNKEGMKDFFIKLLNFNEDKSHSEDCSKAFREAFDLLATEYAHKNAVEAVQDPDNSRFI